VRVALVGFGPAGAGLHAPLIANTPGMRLAVVVTSNPERQERVLTEYPEASVLPSADRIWEEPDQCDLVVVAAPNRAHAELAEASMRAGLPVVVDKPLAVSTEDAERLVTTSRETGVPLAVFHNRRWDSDHLAARQAVESGDLGEIARYEARWERWRPKVQTTRWRELAAEEEGGGLLYDLGSHLIDQAVMLFGHPTHVYAELARRRPEARVDDDSFVTLRYEHGPTVHLWMSLVAIEPGPRVRVTGLSGLFECEGVDPQEARLSGREAPEVRVRMVTEEAGRTHEQRIDPPPGDWGAFYEGVRDALREGGPMPVTGEEGAEVVRVIHAARASAKSGEVQSL
jgi:scyllo-inositol 2-dehydrogenase (NADP+)